METCIQVGAVAQTLFSMRFDNFFKMQFLTIFIAFESAFRSCSMGAEFHNLRAYIKNRNEVNDEKRISK